MKIMVLICALFQRLRQIEIAITGHPVRMLSRAQCVLFIFVKASKVKNIHDYGELSKNH